MFRRFSRVGVILAALLLTARAVAAGEATIAAAANFAGTLEKLQKEFEAASDHKLTLISGSTGKLTAQITEGAPFDLLLSADDKAAKKLMESGHAVTDSEFTYAIGTLALFSADPELVKDAPNVLKEGKFRNLAIANPKLAPYGVASEQTMKALGVYDAVKDKIVMGENIGQTFTMISKGADLGFVALSQVLGSEEAKKGSHWVVPGNLHAPIRQNAVLLKRAESNEAAKEFLVYLRSPEAREQIEAAGYSSEFNPS
jgi:molybdate transport system substrate-binding protein